MSIYKVVSESQVKRLRQLGFQIVPIAGTVLVPHTDIAGETLAIDLAAAMDEPETIDAPAEPASAPVAGAEPDAGPLAPETPAPAPAIVLRNLVAVHRGRGSYSIMDGDAERAEGLTKKQAAAFNDLPAADRPAALADHLARA